MTTSVRRGASSDGGHLRTAPAVPAPDLDARATAWLRSSEDPLVRFQVARHLGPLPSPPAASDPPSALRAAVLLDPRIAAALSSQRPDGSWGEAADPRRRVLPTLWMVKVLAELGLDASCPAWDTGADFLADRAHTTAGIFSLGGADSGVLSCYVGIAASTYLLGRRPDLAGPQVRWIVDHQEVQDRGESLRSGPVPLFSPHLRTRYGGCMATTTCLVGLVKTGTALALWTAEHDDREARGLLREVRQAFWRRRLLHRHDGGVVPLGTTATKPETWLAPTFPLDWRTDLLEVLTLAGPGAEPEVLAPAIGLVHDHRLPDGTWPLRRTFRPAHLPALEHRSTRTGSPFVTVRALAALRATQVGTTRT